MDFKYNQDIFKRNEDEAYWQYLFSISKDIESQMLQMEAEYILSANEIENAYHF